MGILPKKIGTTTTTHHKQPSAVEVVGWDINTGVTIGEVNQVMAALVALQEATALLVLVVDFSVVVALETQNNIKMV